MNERGPVSGRGLHEIGAGASADAAEFDLLRVVEEAALEDDLEDPPRGVDGLAHGGDVVFDVFPVVVLDFGDVDDHVELRRAVFHRDARLGDLGRRGVRPVREADHGAGFDSGPGERLGGSGDEKRADAHARAAVRGGVAARFFESLAAALRREDGVVDAGCDFGAGGHGAVSVSAFFTARRRRRSFRISSWGSWR